MATACFRASIGDKDLAVLKALFNWCMARSLAASNPVCRVQFFNEDNARLRYLTEDEYSRLIQDAKTIATSPLLAEKIILSVHTGLRRCSLFHLRWDYVDCLNRVVRIPRTKSGRPHAVPLNATVLTTLQTLYTERLTDCQYVFAHSTGRQAGEPVKDVKNVDSQDSGNSLWLSSLAQRLEWSAYDESRANPVTYLAVQDLAAGDRGAPKCGEGQVAESHGISERMEYLRITGPSGGDSLREGT